MFGLLTHCTRVLCHSADEKETEKKMRKKNIVPAHLVQQYRGQQTDQNRSVALLENLTELALNRSRVLTKLCLFSSNK